LICGSQRFVAARSGFSTPAALWRAAGVFFLPIESTGCRSPVLQGAGGARSIAAKTLRGLLRSRCGGPDRGFVLGQGEPDFYLAVSWP